MALSPSDVDVIVISLISRQDRRTAIGAALDREGVAYRFFDAVPAPTERPENWKLSLPLWACRESHISVLESATRPTLVFEDDADIPAGFIDTLTRLLNELPDEWRVLRLGGAHLRPPEVFSQHLVRSRGARIPTPTWCGTRRRQ